MRKVLSLALVASSLVAMGQNKRPVIRSRDILPLQAPARPAPSQETVFDTLIDGGVSDPEDAAADRRNRKELAPGSLYQSPTSRETFYVTDNSVHRAVLPSDTNKLPKGQPGEIRELAVPERGNVKALWQATDDAWVSVADRDTFDAIQAGRDPFTEVQQTAARKSDPLVLDIAGNGIKLLGPASKIRFDVDADNFAEITGWIGGKDDALLVLDRNNDGRINNGTELFGMTSQNPNQANGFVVLKALDTNNDNVIDRQDSQFGQLRLWFDHDRNGVAAAATELVPLEVMHIEKIRLDYKSDRFRQDRHGNLLREYSTFEIRLKDGTVEDRGIVNVWFKSHVIR